MISLKHRTAQRNPDRLAKADTMGHAVRMRMTLGLSVTGELNECNRHGGQNHFHHEFGVPRIAVAR
ncbi:hypothetical protein NSMM_260023 [Nitrosomonas mobilis]|uniref:Uncharacterized protein n=1 Tax=Nitrosomonas mobilis TaxID=51642 RepID=A0A1G5SCL6_9PROT|nr:hypothetical protein NSMM_260023 [Nitrosomonas mobilis]